MPHGDFLTKNLLWNGTAYVAIDLIPAIGDPCADIGFFAVGDPRMTPVVVRGRAGSAA